MPKKGLPDYCPKCGEWGRFKCEPKSKYISVECLNCNHMFKSRSRIARRRLSEEK